MKWLLPVLFAAGCGGIACTTEYRYGLSVTVKDAAGAAICDATVRAVDGSYTETLTARGCTYVGAGERGGRYQITAEKTGFQPTTVEVTVGEDECHVIPQSRELVLTK